MSTSSQSNVTPEVRRTAPIFAAIGDPVRLTLLTKLGSGQRHSITQLSHGATISRQAVTKHLRVLQAAGLVQVTRRGRESLFQLDPTPLRAARDSLDAISEQWDAALGRLKSFVEEQKD